MKALLATFMLLLAPLIARAGSIQTVTITLNDGSIKSGANIVRIPFTGLAGTPVAGESEIINFLFTNPIPQFGPLGATLILQTNEPFPGLMHGVGYISGIGTSGSPYGLGAADCSCGFTAVGFYPTLTTLTEIYGFQFDVTYPDRTDVYIGDGQLAINYTATPEPATWGTLMLAMAVAMGLKRKIAA